MEHFRIYNKNMKAVQIATYGGPEVLQVNTVEKPAIQNNQVLVEVKAAGLNPIDVKLAAGFLKQMIPLQFPATLGGDIAGVITEVGNDVHTFAKGDEIYGQASVYNGGSGAFAESAAAQTEKIAKKPQTATFEQAAALPVVGASAVQALEEHFKLQKGQKILIHGGAGGIGHIAIQIAKHIGAYVATTVSTKNIDFVKQLGADEVIDYKEQQFDQILKDFDAVYDTVGGETTNKSFTVLKKGGTLVTMLGMPNQELSEKYGVVGIGQRTNTNTTHLNRLAELVDQKIVTVHIDSVFPLEKAKEAFEKQNTNPQGKIIFQMPQATTL